jgi:hypothetical protein
MRVTMKFFIIAKSRPAAAFFPGECHCAAGAISIQSRPSGEVSEWLKEHAWKVCIRKRIEGSNPSFSAIQSGLCNTSLRSRNNVSRIQLVTQCKMGNSTL